MIDSALPLLDWFENKMNRKYPPFIKDFINQVLQKENNPVIQIELNRYGPFELLDFKKLEAVRDGSLAHPSWQDELENPWYIISTIQQFMTRNFGEQYSSPFLELLPFAKSRLRDQTEFLCLLPADNRPFYVDTLYDKKKPLLLPAPLTDLADFNAAIESLHNEQRNRYYVWSKQTIWDLLPPQRIYVGDYTSVDDASSYEPILKGLLATTGKKYVLQKFSAEEKDGTRLLHLQINKLECVLQLEGNTKWVDAGNVVTQLNACLFNEQSKYQFIKLDLPSGGEYCILYGTAAEAEKASKG